MLSDQEKLCLSEFLESLDDVRLKSISGSVTLGRIECNSREEAISCVLLHSESLISVFRRKKVSSSLLLKYLNLKQISVPGDATKETMIRQIFDFWKIAYTPASLHGQQSATWTSSFSTAPQISTSLSAGATSSAVQPFQVSLNDQSLAANNLSYHSLKEMLNTEKMIREANALALDDFVLKFATTFYNLLNTPDAGICCQHSLNTSHFFERCEMTIKIVGDVEEHEVVCDGCEGVLKNLSDLRKQHQLHFSPNLTPDGVRGKQNWDGLMYAMACGTLHQPAGVVGHFKQSFVLSADPFQQGSCKIKESTLIVMSSKAVPSRSQQMLMSTPERNQHLALEGP